MNARENKKEISEKLVYLRENNGLTVEEIAAHIGIQVKQLQDIEAGTGDFLNDQLIEKFSNVFQVPISYLTDCSVRNDNEYGFLARAIEKLSKNDHEELLKFAEFLKLSPRDK